MRKIIDLCHIFGFGPDKLGAIENYIFSIQKYCNENNIKVLFVFTREPIDEFKKEFKKLQGRYIIIKHGHAVFSLKFSIKLYKILKQYNPQIVHSHFDSVNLQVALIAKILKIPKIFWHQRNVFGEKLWYLRNIIYRWLSTYVTNIIAVSSAVKEDLLKRRIDRNKIVVLNNGIDINRVTSSGCKYFKQEQNIEKGKKVVLTVAQARPEKDLMTLLKAISFVESRKNLEFVIVGGGLLVPELKEYAKSKGYDNVRFLDKRNDIKNIMEDSDIFVLPSKKEGLPNVIPEAMLNHVPVIASRVGGIPEFIIHEKTGLLFEVGDYKQLAVNIDRLNQDKDLRKKLIENSYKHIAENFNLEDKIKYTFKKLYKL